MRISVFLSCNFFDFLCNLCTPGRTSAGLAFRVTHIFDKNCNNLPTYSKSFTVPYLIIWRVTFYTYVVYEGLAFEIISEYKKVLFYYFSIHNIMQLSVYSELVSYLTNIATVIWTRFSVPEMVDGRWQSFQRQSIGLFSDPQSVPDWPL